jgi:hypothetical protein
MNERLNIMLRLKERWCDSACLYNMISFWYCDMVTITVYTTVLTNADGLYNCTYKIE